MAPRTLVAARHQQGHDRDLDLRPPHHPGRGVRPLPRPHRGAAQGRGRLLRADLRGPRTSPPAGQVGDGRAPRALRTDGRARGDREAGPRPPAHPRLPRARPPRGRPRPPRLEARSPTGTSIPPPTGSRSGTSTASSSRTASPARTRPRCARSSRSCARPTAARSASSTCTSPTRSGRTGSRSAWSRRGTIRPSTRRARGGCSRRSWRRRASSASSTRSTSATSASRWRAVETLIPLLDRILNDAAQQGVDEAVIGMAHRGRLNVLANTVGKPLAQIFSEFEGNIDPDSTQGSGDVKYHLGATGTHHADTGETLTVSLAPNPSHLEWVDPVVEGMARARQDALGDRDRSNVIPILLHGDAAFAGQGIVAETLNLAGLEGYHTGGTIHVVVNNQIGFTTLPEDARSSTYCTDVAKMVHAPAFHVNADDPEAVVYVAGLALEYRQRFKKDVVIDLVGYRRWGHNEGDEPSYTQPLMYAKIKNHTLGGPALRRAARAAGNDQPRGAGQALGGEEGGDAARGRRGSARSHRPPRPRGAAGRGRGRDVGPAPDRPEGPGLAARGFRDPPQARGLRQEAAGAARRQGRRGLGHRGVAGLGDAAPRGRPRASLRPGHGPRHVQPAPRHPLRREDRARVRPPERAGSRRRALRGLRLACSPRPRSWASSSATRWPSTGRS